MGCGYRWTYAGNMRIYATCPNCRRGVKIDKAKEYNKR